MIINNGTCYATEATTSLKITTPELSDTIMPNTTSYLSSEVIYSAENIESYALKVSYAEGSNSLKLENSAAVIANTNNTQGTLAKNTWGYAWGDVNVDNSALTYQAMPSYNNATTIEQGTEDIGSTTKKIVFAANIGDDMPTGHYKTNVLLSLVATPKVIALGVWSNGTNSGITTMQEMTPEICNQVGTPTAVGTPGGTKAPTLKLKDSRDENEYTIAKLPDGKCWMVENLHLAGGITLKSSDSNVTNDFDLPDSLTDSNLNADTGDVCSKNFYSGGSTSNTSCYTKAQSYITTPSAEAGVTGYYSWCAATAGTCTSATAQYKEATASICPLGWKLPTGYGSESGNNDFYDLFSKMNLGITVNTGGNTSWGTSQGLAISQGSPYKFAYTGAVGNGSFVSDSAGRWWSRTAYSSTFAYRLYIDSSYVGPGTNYFDRYLGYAVRCVADDPEPKTYTITYYPNNPRFGGSASTETCTTYDNTCTITKENPASPCTNHTFLGWSTSDSATSPTYSLGSKLTMSADLTLYGVWNGSGNICA